MTNPLGQNHSFSMSFLQARCVTLLRLKLTPPETGRRTQGCGGGHSSWGNQGCLAEVFLSGPTHTCRGRESGSSCPRESCTEALLRRLPYHSPWRPLLHPPGGNLSQTLGPQAHPCLWPHVPPRNRLCENHLPAGLMPSLCRESPSSSPRLHHTWRRGECSCDGRHPPSQNEEF